MVTHSGYLKNCSSLCCGFDIAIISTNTWRTEYIGQAYCIYASLLRKHWRAVVNAAKMADFFNNWLYSGVMRFLQADNFGSFTATM
jgi:hypothetical protein